MSDKAKRPAVKANPNPNMTKTEFKAIMKRNGWNKPVVAKLIGQTDRNVAHYMAGDYNIPRAIVIVMRLVDQGSLGYSDAISV